MALPELIDLEALRASLQGGAGLGARTAADLPDEALQDELDDAHAEVLGKLATGWVIPADAATAPTMVKSLILSIAAYAATLVWLQGKDLSERDPIVLRYTRATTLLRQIVAGDYVVDGLEKSGVASGVVESYDALPYMGLADDVAAPTYYGGSLSERFGRGDWRTGP